MFSKDAYHDEILCYGTAYTGTGVWVQSILPHVLAKPMRIYTDLDPDALPSKYNYNLKKKRNVNKYRVPVVGSKKLRLWKSWIQYQIYLVNFVKLIAAGSGFTRNESKRIDTSDAEL
jgi:hypothetical protein